MTVVLTVLDGGLRATVQDRGRFGWEHLGVARGGALDGLAYAWANRLAGNPDGAAVLECLLRGVKVEVSHSLWLATAGVEVVTVNGRRFPAWSGFEVAAGSVVSLDRLAGARGYLSVHGGIDVEPVLGSRCTNPEAGFGGYRGRAVHAGDVLPVGQSILPAPRGQLWRCTHPPPISRPVRVRLLAGPRRDSWSRQAIEWLRSAAFAVSPQSSHMGIRLHGTPFAAAGSGSETSEPMPVGAVQVTPSGHPVVLLAARGTIGGYPVPATVITADMWLLGQARPGEELRFEVVTEDEAAEAGARSEREREAIQPVRITLQRGGAG